MVSERKATILHTNDFHNKLKPEQAAYIRRRKANLEADVLLLDAGDAISAGNVGVRIGGEPILELMGEIGYDAMTLGNREFHISDLLLRHKIANATFPILCANIRYQKDGESALPLTPALLLTLGNGLKITVIGVTVPMVTTKMSARVLSSYLFDDPIETVKRLAFELRKKCDILIALTHIGIKEDIRLAGAVPELDLIIGGHSHVVLDDPLTEHGVPIVQAGWFGHYLGEVSLIVGSSGVSVTTSTLTDLRAVGVGED